MDPVYRMDIKVPAEVVDGNGHVNNVAYVQWMQEAAIRHAAATGCTQATQALGATWVARTHHVEYLRPAFAGDTVRVLTWVSDFRKVRSLRKYKFVRTGDSVVLAQAEGAASFAGDGHHGQRPARRPTLVVGLADRSFRLGLREGKHGIRIVVCEVAKWAAVHAELRQGVLCRAFGLVGAGVWCMEEAPGYLGGAAGQLQIYPL